MARDTAAIGADVVIGENTPPVETTVEALIRQYNRQPLNSSLSTGDLVYWDATAGAWVRVAGTKSAGQLPVAQADGTVAWGNGSSQTLTAGRYIAPFAGSLTSFAPALDSVRYVPFLIPETTNLDLILCEVLTAGGAGAVARLGLYTDSNGGPGTLVVDAGTVAATTTGVKTIVIAATVEAGVYWTACVTQGAAGVAYRSMTGMDPGAYTTNQAAVLSNPSLGFASSAAVSGALPSPAAYLDGGVTTVPRVGVRTA